MRTLNIKQLEHESLIDYMKRFKQSRDVLKSHIGGDILSIRAMDGIHDDQEQ